MRPWFVPRSQFYKNSGRICVETVTTTGRNEAPEGILPTTARGSQASGGGVTETTGSSTLTGGHVETAGDGYFSTVGGWSCATRSRPFVPATDVVQCTKLGCRIQESFSTCTFATDGNCLWDFLTGQRLQLYDAKWKSEKVCFEILVSHVFRKWRAIALGTANLWKSASVFLGEPERMHAYMSRSAEALLQVNLLSRIETSSDELRCIWSVLIAPHLHRVESLSFICRCPFQLK